MHPFPHQYPVSATASVDSVVTLAAPGVDPIESAGPVEFGGPGDRWSPESLLVAAVADCFVLSFRAIARAARLDWLDLNCRVEGTLDRVDRVSRFTDFWLEATLTIGPEADAAKAEQLLHKAESSCLITNSLLADSHLQTKVLVR